MTKLTKQNQKQKKSGFPLESCGNDNLGLFGNDHLSFVIPALDCHSRMVLSGIHFKTFFTIIVLFRLILIPGIGPAAAKPELSSAEFYQMTGKLFKENKKAALKQFQMFVKYYCTIPINTAEFPNNQVLSQERAKAVAKYFIDESKLAANRFSVKGFGELKPIAPNTTEEEKRKNRRVEIILLKGKRVQ